MASLQRGQRLLELLRWKNQQILKIRTPTFLQYVIQRAVVLHEG